MTVSTTGPSNLAGALDLNSVLRATQAISGEIVLSTLLTRVMTVVMESAGAERGFLILNGEDGWVIEVGAFLRPGSSAPLVEIMGDDKLDEFDRLARRVVHYVARTRESVILDDARTSALFAKDAYIQSAQPLSLLCLPLSSKGEVTGLLYLENNQAQGAFTEDRSELLTLVSGQAAISLENARLYDAQLQLNEAAIRFVPHEFLNFLGKENLAQCTLGDHVSQVMTVLFSDSRDFTPTSERLGAEATFEFVNAYLHKIGPIIREHRGFIMSYIGDAIMALFPAADDGLRAGLAMLEALAEINAAKEGTDEEPIEIGIGLNTGVLMLGTIGEPNRMEGTVISDAVNLASRVEGLTKRLDEPMLISQQVVDRLAAPEAYALTPLDRVEVKGKSEPVQIYAVRSPSQS